LTVFSLVEHESLLGISTKRRL